MKKKPKNLNPVPPLSSDDVVLLSEVKQRIRAAQLRTAMAANAGALMLPWEIGTIRRGRLQAGEPECWPGLPPISRMNCLTKKGSLSVT